MQRSRLRNAYLKDRTSAANKKQINVCVSILRESKKCYYENLDTKNITDNKKFWGTVKPVFSNKVRSNTYITLNEDEKSIKNSQHFQHIFYSKCILISVIFSLNINVALLSDTVPKAAS